MKKDNMAASVNRPCKKKIVDNTMRFCNGDVSLDEAIERNGWHLVWPKNGRSHVLFDASW